LTQHPSRTPGRVWDPVTVGTLLGVLSALAYTGTNMALRSLADGGGGDWAVWVSAWKGLPAALAAWAIIGYRAARGLPALPPRRLWPMLLLAALFMQFGGNVLFQWSLSQVGLALTVPLTFATILLSSAVLGRFVLLEAVTRRTAAAIGFLILAITLLSAGGDEAARSVLHRATAWSVAAAVLAATVSGVAYGASGVMIRRAVIENVPISATLMFFSTTGVVVLGLTSLIRLGPARLLQTEPGDVGVMLTAGALNAIAFFAIGAAFRRIPVVRANLINASQAALCGAAGVIWFGEAVTPWLLTGGGLTVVGLLIMDSRRPPAETIDAHATPIPGPIDRERLLSETFVRSVEHHAEIGSTNDRALALAAKTMTDDATPALVVADRQTAGRGRGRNTWWAADGALTFSLVLDAHAHRLPPGRWPTIALTVGLAVCETLCEPLAPRRPRLKWPNDVLLDGRKLCGILIEVPSSAAGRVVIGVGLNVNNPLTDAPPEVRQRATSLIDETGRTHDRTDLLIGILRRLDHDLALLSVGAQAALQHRWSEWCDLTGRTVAVYQGEQVVEGVCEGIDADGALRLRTPFGPERLYSGVVAAIGE
jgi:BirA family biotin operon repressor/biotin-[acetyl-CoA-carboxylase] ligase